ncbi:MAG: HAMP domain-containing histidine kinase [Sphingomonadales bacterium]|nr:HAMP domain-containing histidine kinase [Sphingomonadales bacterium]MDE2170754.1 HAMP domain-containing histidine kinase [Sphingomonadales bacterium]
MAHWRHSLEGKLILRLAGIHALALAIGFLALAQRHYLLRHGVSDTIVVWAFPLFAFAVLGVVIYTVRASLRPLIAASRQAAAIVPGAAGARLEPGRAPAEIMPFIHAVNEALERLDQAFQAQRRFTADAAHELRTPLAILTAGIEALPPGEAVTKLGEDAARMSRLVIQLLRVARLDSQPLPQMQAVDLAQIAAEVGGHMAPWIYQQGREVVLEAPDRPVLVHGDEEALSGALRNLIENAVFHAPVGTEVLVTVLPEGRLSVIDHGAGVPPEHRAQLFERFWRAHGMRRQGAGLGLSIVAAVAQAHGASIMVEDTPGGGATFTMDFPMR